MTEVKNSHITTKSSKFYYKKKRREARVLTRDTTLLIRLKEPAFSNIDYLTILPTDLPTLREAFFSDKVHLPYNREHWLRKLMLCQCVMQQEQTMAAKSTPFVIRFNYHDMKLDLTKLKRKIRDTFKKALREVPLYWINFEYNIKGTRNRHCNGEILINPELLPALKNALERMYGLNNAGIKQAIKFPAGSRERQAKKHGSFYAVYNWAGYSTKESTMLRIERDRLKNKKIDEGKFYSISTALNSKAKILHQEITLKSKS